jgi:hypothetical protein
MYREPGSSSAAPGNFRQARLFVENVLDTVHSWVYDVVASLAIARRTTVSSFMEPYPLVPSVGLLLFWLIRHSLCAR